MIPIHVPRGEGELVHIFGVPIHIRLRAGETNGALGLFESHDPAGDGPPPHIHHREDETFHILEGDYEFRVGDRSIRARPGDTLFAPRSVPHSYRCLSPEGGRISVTLTPAGFDAFFQQVGAMSPAEQKDFPRIAQLAADFGLEFLAPGN
jgi:quercetin dioxygenase-like cupin family protein